MRLILTAAARAPILPPLGWDSITDHAVKAGMWVQTGGSLPLVDEPGQGVRSLLRASTSQLLRTVR